MVIKEIARLQQLAGMLDRYESYFPNTSEVVLTESELADFESQWKLIEEELPTKKEPDGSMVDPRVVAVSKNVIKGFMLVSKKIMILANKFGKYGQTFMGFLKWIGTKLWKNKVLIGVSAALGLSYQFVMDSLNWIHNTRPRVTDGVEWMFQFDTGDKPWGTAIDEWARTAGAQWWAESIVKFKEYEASGIKDFAWDKLQEIIAVFMQMAGAVAPALVEWSVGLVKLINDLGAWGWLGSIASWLVFMGIIIGVKDVTKKLTAPIVQWGIKWWTTVDPKDQIVTDVENELKVINPDEPNKRLSPHDILTPPVEPNKNT